MSKVIEHKTKGNNAWNTLRRLFKLTKFLTELGKEGAKWDDIRKNIYEGESDANNESLYRKFRRDQEALKGLYYEEEDYEDPLDYQSFIVKDELGKYKIRSGVSLMFPVKLDENQALALASSVKIVPGFMPLFKDASDQIWSKLQNHISPELKTGCELLTETIMPAIPVSKAGEDPNLNDVLEAISTKKVLNTRQYQSVYPNDPSSCRFSPWILFLKYHSWYILGEMETGNKLETRVLRVDRIKKLEILDEEQPNPCDRKKLKQLQNDIRLDKYGHTDCPMPKNGWNIKLHITGSFAKPCMETQWFPGEKKTMLKDGSVDYEVKLKGLEEITLWIMRALNCMEVVEPKELRNIIDKRVDEYLERRRQRKAGKD